MDSDPIGVHMMVPQGDTPAFFAPQELLRVFAAHEVLFLVDPVRLGDLGGSELLRDVDAADRRGRGPAALIQGAAVAAIGLEAGYYTVMVRSTDTQDAMVPLSNIVFSAGFVLGSASGELEVWNGDRLVRESGRRESVPLKVNVAPGWYSVTVVAGIKLDGAGAETQEWVCCFLLEPRAARPELTCDPGQTLALFG